MRACRFRPPKESAAGLSSGVTTPLWMRGACVRGWPIHLFAVSGEPQAIKFESRHYSSPGDAERAGYEALAAKGLQTLDIDAARRARSGQERSSSPYGESG
jgi:hypothetical protein